MVLRITSPIACLLLIGGFLLLALDSANAEAYAGLSSVYALSLAYRYQTGVDGYTAAGLALAAADRAIELEPTLASGYSARGYLASRSFAPVSRVASDCRKAIDLEPSAADVLSWCARVLSRSGAIETAFRVSEQAIALDPQNAGRRLALAYDALAKGDDSHRAIGTIPFSVGGDVSDSVLIANILGDLFANRDYIVALLREIGGTAGCPGQLFQHARIPVWILRIEDSNSVNKSAGLSGQRA